MEHPGPGSRTISRVPGTKSRATRRKIHPIRDLPLSEPFFRRGIKEELGTGWPSLVSAMGEIEILENPTLALFCSGKCPGSLILETHEFVSHLGQAGPVIVSGFHSPMERHCLEVLLCRRVAFIICPARNLKGMRIPRPWRTAIDENRLLIISPFDLPIRRATKNLAKERNRFVAALADRVLISYARPGGMSERFARDLAKIGKPLMTFESPDNRLLLDLGAVSIQKTGDRSEAAVNLVSTLQPSVFPVETGKGVQLHARSIGARHRR